MVSVSAKGDQMNLADKRMNDYFECLPVKWKSPQVEPGAQLNIGSLHVEHFPVGVDPYRRIAGRAHRDTVDELQARIPNLAGLEPAEALRAVSRDKTQPRTAT